MLLLQLLLLLAHATTFVNAVTIVTALPPLTSIRFRRAATVTLAFTRLWPPLLPLSLPHYRYSGPLVTLALLPWLNCLYAAAALLPAVANYCYYRYSDTATAGACYIITGDMLFSH